MGPCAAQQENRRKKIIASNRPVAPGDKQMNPARASIPETGFTNGYR
jgi:hypothetical protein